MRQWRNDAPSFVKRLSESIGESANVLPMTTTLKLPLIEDDSSMQTALQPAGVRLVRGHAAGQDATLRLQLAAALTSGSK
jgi:hypothetical protein